MPHFTGQWPQQWHPRWEENIDSEVNATFINAVADRVYQNELCQSNLL